MSYVRDADHGWWTCGLQLLPIGRSLMLISTLQFSRLFDEHDDHAVQ
jgi:hypothetical protein